jgi:hypothetical protein
MAELALALLVCCVLCTKNAATPDFKPPASGPRPSGPFMGAELELEELARPSWPASANQHGAGAVLAVD